MKNSLLTLVIYFSINSLLSAQIIDYLPQTPGPITACQKNVTCPLGSSLSSQRNAVGLLYFPTSSSGKNVSEYLGTAFIIRQAGVNASNILLTSRTATRTPYNNMWIRYKYYASTCSGSNPSAVSYHKSFQYEYIEDKLISELQAFKLRYVQGPYTQPTVWLPALGWSLLDQTSGTAKSIGHPNGNGQKVTSFNNLTKSVNLGQDVWQMNITDGFIESKQLGSPVFNSSNYVIGVIFNVSNANCNGTIPTGTANAHRLSKYYRSFSEYLDPQHTGAVQVPTWSNGNVQIGEYKYPSLSKSTGTLCFGVVGNVSINNFCEFMEGYTTWSVSDPGLVNITPASNGQTLQISPKTSDSNGQITVTATIDFGGWQKSYSTTVQIGIVIGSQLIVNGPAAACPNDNVNISCNYIEGVDNYTWQWGNTFQYLSGQGTRYLTLQASSNFNGDAVLLSSTHNACGWWSGPPSVKYIPKNYSCSYNYSVSPNPAISEVVVEVMPDENTLNKEMVLSQEFDIQIFDNNNVKIKEIKGVKGKITIDVKKFNKGELYLIVITDKNKTETKKLIVE